MTVHQVGFRIVLLGVCVGLVGCGSKSTTTPAPGSNSATTPNGSGSPSEKTVPPPSDKPSAQNEKATGQASPPSNVPRDNAESISALTAAGARLQLDPSGHVVTAVLTGATDKDLAGLAGLAQLRSLKLAAPADAATRPTGISETGWKSLGSLPGLAELSLSGLPIRDTDVGQLALAARLEHLDLSWTPITDEALAALARMTQLQSLDVSYTAVSDSGIEPLAALPNLRLVLAEGSDVTDGGRAKLRASRPELAFGSVSPIVANALAAARPAGADSEVEGELGPGRRAPEIEGEDIEGVKFKLSDYRGQVVMLDFWGHW